MIILQTVSGGQGGGIGLGADILGIESSSTTFRENDYIHKLNRLLQSEMRAVSAYNGLLSRVDMSHPFNDLCVNHQMAGKALARLVISNRGIPEDRTAVSVGWTKTFFVVCSSIPGRLFETATITSLGQLEKTLQSSYLKIMDLAPARDLEDLRHLLNDAQNRLNELRQIQGPR